MTHLSSAAGSAAARLYTWELERAYRRGREVYDPDYGLAQDPDVYDVIRRDPETNHAITYRKHLVAGTRWRVAPASDEEVDRRAAGLVEQVLGGIHNFTPSRFHLADAIFKGSAWAIVEGRRAPKRIGKTVRAWWTPTRLRAVDKRRFRQVVKPDGQVEWQFFSVARAAWEDLGDRRRWFVRVAYDETEDSLSYGRGLVEALYHWQYAKGKVLAEGLAGLERWAQGVIVGKVQGMRQGDKTRSNEAHANATLTALENMRSRHLIVHGDEDDLSLVETSGTGHEMVKDFLAYLSHGITRLILGANLPTGATSGGSYAMAEVQENSTEALVQFDRDLVGEAITSDLVSLVWTMNAEALRAEGVLEATLPRLQIVSRMRRDPTATATSIGALLNAGVQGLREDEVFDVLGFTPASEHDRQLRVVRPNDSPANGQAKGVESQDEEQEERREERVEAREERQAFYAAITAREPAPPAAAPINVHVAPPAVTVNVAPSPAPNVHVDGPTVNVAPSPAPNVSIEAPAPVVVPAPLVTVEAAAAPPPLVIPAGVTHVTVQAPPAPEPLVLPAPHVTVLVPPDPPTMKELEVVDRDVLGRVKKLTVTERSA